MKKILTLIAIVTIALIGCQNPAPAPTPEPPTPPTPSVDFRDTVISIRPAAGVKSSENPEHLSAREIVVQTVDFKAKTRDNRVINRGFSDKQRDTVENRLMMFSIDVIDNYGEINEFSVLSFRDFTLTRLISEPGEEWVFDTIAYLPNSIVIETEKLVHQAYDKGDYEECYRLFDEAYRFIPITGAEWRALNQ